MTAKNLFYQITLVVLAMLIGIGCTGPGSAGGGSSVETPVISPASGTITDYTDIEITTATAGATIYYTTDGSDPVTGTPITYSGPFNLAGGSSYTVRAYAILSGLSDSAEASTDFTVETTVVAVNFEDSLGDPIPSGSIPDNQDIYLATTTPSATIYYTTDGSDPTSSGTVQTYSVPFTLASTGEDPLTIKAYATAAGLADSETSQADYTKAVAADPVSDRTDGSTISTTMAVTLSTTTIGAEIYYTTDGVTTPDAASTSYTVTGPFTLPVGSTTVQAIAIAAGYTDSAVTSVTLNVETQADDPTVDVNSGFISAGTPVTLSNGGVQGETIYYTLDGSDPKTSGTAITYSAPFAVNSSSTLRVYAGGAGFYDSAEVTRDYLVYQSIDTLTADTGAKMAVASDGSVVVYASGTFYDLSAGSLTARVLSNIPAGTVLDFAVDGSGNLHVLILDGSAVKYWVSDNLSTATVSSAAVSLADGRILIDSSGNAFMAFAQYKDVNIDEVVEVVYSDPTTAVRTVVSDLQDRATGIDAALNSSAEMIIAVSGVKGSSQETKVLSYDAVGTAWTTLLDWKNNAGVPSVAVRNDDSIVIGYTRVRPGDDWYEISEVELLAANALTTNKPNAATISADSSIAIDPNGNIFFAADDFAWMYDGSTATELSITEEPYIFAEDPSGTEDLYFLGTSGLGLYAMK